MGGARVGGKAVWAQGLMARVECWRESRRKGSAMPGELWEAAVELAAEHGVYAVSRQLRMSYESLRRRVERETGRGLRDEAGGSFVEVRAAQLLGSAAERAVPRRSARALGRPSCSMHRATTNAGDREVPWEPNARPPRRKDRGVVSV